MNYGNIEFPSKSVNEHKNYNFKRRTICISLKLLRVAGFKKYVCNVEKEKRIEIHREHITKKFLLESESYRWNSSHLNDIVEDAGDVSM